MPAPDPCTGTSPRERGTAFREEVAVGLRFVWRDAYLRVFTIHAEAGNLGAAAMQAIMVVFLVREVGLSQSLVGLLVGAVSVGGVIGAFTVTKVADRLGAARTILPAELGLTPLALLIAPTTDGWASSSCLSAGSW